MTKKYSVKPGDRFGSWTALDKIIKNKRNARLRLFKCDCGTEKYSVSSFIAAGHSKKCQHCVRANDIKPGDQFGKWAGLDTGTSTGLEVIYLCRCECGFEKSTKRGDLVSGKTTKCRTCYQSNLGGQETHGMRKTKTYTVWACMLDRCRRPKNKDHKHYGGRGITVCEKWHKFEGFYEDMRDRPENAELDRINNDLGYFKENCRWVSHKENCNNRRTSASRNKNKVGQI